MSIMSCRMMDDSGHWLLAVAILGAANERGAASSGFLISGLGLGLKGPGA
jgi:hypothetical protein